MNKHLLISLALIGLLAGACAKSSTSTTGQTAQEYLKLWIDKYHPGTTANEDGLYILQDVPGTGEAWNSEKAYVLVNVTIRTLSGTVSTTTNEKLSQQLGTYVKGYYYGPKYQMLGFGTSYAGVDALLKGMKIGGTRTAVVPAWMLTTSRYDTQKEYLDACTSSSHLIYEITLEGQTDNPDAEAASYLEKYVRETYGADIKPVSYVSGEQADTTFWFVSDTTAFAGTEHLASDASVSLNYTGILLPDGSVFDTTVEKVAKDAGIYQASKTYKAQTVQFASSYDSITLGGSSSLINGFKGGLSLMHWKGQKAAILFTSKHGYSSSGSGYVIPGYAPLLFELEILAD